MAFNAAERRVLLAVRGGGPTVVARLEQLGIDRLDLLARQDAVAICTAAAALTGGTCWRNSPQARAAVEGAITAAAGALPGAQSPPALGRGWRTPN